MCGAVIHVGKRPISKKIIKIKSRHTHTHTTQLGNKLQPRNNVLVTFYTCNDAIFAMHMKHGGSLHEICVFLPSVQTNEILLIYHTYSRRYNYMHKIARISL